MYELRSVIGGKKKNRILTIFDQFLWVTPFDFFDDFSRKQTAKFRPRCPNVAERGNGDGASAGPATMYSQSARDGAAP